MMEYRVIYYTDEPDIGIGGSAFDPWIAYQGYDLAEAESTFADLRNDGPNNLQIQLQSREVFGWATIQRLRVSKPDVKKGNVH